MLLVIKHFVVRLPWTTKRRRLLLPAMSVTNFPRSGAAVCITLGSRTVDNTRWNQLFVENRDFRLPHQQSKTPSEYRHNVLCGKTRVVWLSGGEKFWRYTDLFRQNAQTWQTNRRTPHDGRHRRRLHRAAKILQKKNVFLRCFWQDELLTGQRH